MNTQACLRLLSGAIIGKACVSELCEYVVWGGKGFRKTIDGGADADGEFRMFVECEPDLICYLPHVYPMNKIEFLSV